MAHVALRHSSSGSLEKIVKVVPSFHSVRYFSLEFWIFDLFEVLVDFFELLLVTGHHELRVRLARPDHLNLQLDKTGRVFKQFAVHLPGLLLRLHELLLRLHINIVKQVFRISRDSGDASFFIVFQQVSQELNHVCLAIFGFLKLG